MTHPCPVCRRDATVHIDGADWALHVCRRHEPAARSVTGVGLRAEPPQGQLFDLDVETAGI